MDNKSREVEKDLKRNKVRMNLTTGEVAKVLRCTTQTVHKMRADGQIEGACIGRKYIYSRAEVSRFIARGM